MSVTYRPFTLGEMVEALRKMPEGSEVRGLDVSVYSYRGFYERNAVAWSSKTRSTREVADLLESQYGNPTCGWKGGDYEVDPDELVYLADYGDTGPQIVGFMFASDGVLEPVLVEEVW